MNKKQNYNLYYNLKFIIIIILKNHNKAFLIIGFKILYFFKLIFFIHINIKYYI